MDGLLDFVTPDQRKAIQEQALTQSLLSLGPALLQASTGAPGQGKPRFGQILGQAVPVGVQAYQGGIDQALRQLLASQQMQEMQRRRAQEQAQMQAREQVMAGLPEAQRQRLTAFPEMAKDVLFPKPEETSQVYRDYLMATRDPINPFTGSFMDYQTELKKAGRTQVSQTSVLGGQQLTPGQVEQDKEFGKEVGQWKRGGGQDMAAQIAQLKPVIESLEAGEPITGVSVAVQPDILLAMTNPKALQSRELVEEVVQRNLRTILGAQFTAQEGERLIARAFNPKLPPEENAKRVRRLFLQMSSAAEQKQAMADYFDQFGTLRGYKGKMPTVQDFYNAMEGGGGTMQIPAGSNLQDAARRELERRRGQ